MTKEQFAAALRELRLPHSSALTARLLGINKRQVFYCLSGRCKVSGAVLPLGLPQGAKGAPRHGLSSMPRGGGRGARGRL
jgi:hypothetical protein